MKLVEMVLYFENMDTITVNAEHVIWISLDGIKQRLYMQNDSDIKMYDTAESISFILSSEANKEVMYGADVFTRITEGQDLISCTFAYEENGVISQKEYHTDWNTDEHINKNQDAVISTDGNLYVKVSDKTLKEIFIYV